jgi:hypothetical protein
MENECNKITMKVEGLNRTTDLVAKLSLCCLFFFISCKSEEKKKEDLALKIAQESCEKMSKLSSDIVGGIVSGIFNSLTGSSNGIETGSLGKIPDNWCNCYCYIVTKELYEKFTNEELEEIYEDKNMQLILLGKILSLRKEELQSCIVETTNEKINNYTDFAKKLDEKFK